MMSQSQPQQKPVTSFTALFSFSCSSIKTSTAFSAAGLWSFCIVTFNIVVVVKQNGEGEQQRRHHKAVQPSQRHGAGSRLAERVNTSLYKKKKRILLPFCLHYFAHLILFSKGNANRPGEWDKQHRWKLKGFWLLPAFCEKSMAAHKRRISKKKNK